MSVCSVHAANGEYPYLEELACYLDEQLKCEQFQSLDMAVNGLQVGQTGQPGYGQRRVRKIAAAVDASLESFERAADLASDLLIVHHGIFWGRAHSIVGATYQRLAMLVEKQLALYAAHLPLDAHMQYGNNIHLAQQLGLENIGGFGNYKGRFIGCMGTFAEPQSMDEICHLLNLPLDTPRWEFSRKANARGIQTVAIVSGSGAMTIEEAAAKGCDLLLTGELHHHHYHNARELGLHILAMGHYRSEMGGVIRLLRMLKKKWPHIATDFIDLPTGL